MVRWAGADYFRLGRRGRNAPAPVDVAARRSRDTGRMMDVSEKLDFDLSDLPLDVFNLEDTGLTVESLLDGHGLPEYVLSSSVCACPCQCSCIVPGEGPQPD